MSAPSTGGGAAEPLAGDEVHLLDEAVDWSHQLDGGEGVLCDHLGLVGLDLGLVHGHLPRARPVHQGAQLSERVLETGGRAVTVASA